MFIYSLRASTLKFFAVVCVALVTLITLIAFIPTFDSSGVMSANAAASYNFDKIKSNEDRINFLSQFGWQVKNDPVESKEVTVPESFDKIFTGYYGAIQQAVDTKRRNAGIGLSVCATIIKAHGGSISAENSAEGGAVFRFTLDVTEADGDVYDEREYTSNE